MRAQIFTRKNGTKIQKCEPSQEKTAYVPVLQPQAPNRPRPPAPPSLQPPASSPNPSLRPRSSPLIPRSFQRFPRDFLDARVWAIILALQQPLVELSQLGKLGRQLRGSRGQSLPQKIGPGIVFLPAANLECTPVAQFRRGAR